MKIQGNYKTNEISLTFGRYEISANVVLELVEARNLALEILEATGYDQKFEQTLPRMQKHLEAGGFEVKGVQYESFEDFMDYQDLDAIIMFQINFDHEDLMYNKVVINDARLAEHCNCYYGLEDGILTFVKKVEP